jgi:hypothetical protein
LIALRRSLGARQAANCPATSNDASPETDDRPSQAKVASTKAAYGFEQIDFEIQQPNHKLFQWKVPHPPVRYD